MDTKETKITRCHNCGGTIHVITADGIIGKPNGHKCEKTYEQLLDENERLEKFIENLQDVHEFEKAKLKAEIEQLQADKAAAVEALRKVGDTRLFPSEWVHIARTTLERLEGGTHE